MKEILIDLDHGRQRLALMVDGKLVETASEEAGNRRQGQIYLGRVMNVLPGMAAAFVDIGLEKNGFLPLEDAPEGIREGQEILLQVQKDIGGDKGARLTSKISLPGRYMVLLPGDRGGVGISHRIGSDGEKERLKRAARGFLRDGFGCILRTAAVDADEKALYDDAQRLYELWERLTVLSAHGRAPALLCRDENLIASAVRDMLGEGVDALWAEGDEVYEEAAYRAGILCPQWADRVKKWPGPGTLFEAKNAEKQAKEALDRRVWLRSGGYLVIDHAEAMTVIDVNSGKFTGKDDVEDTIFAINREAAGEIARQLRLRDVGGIVVVDFIDMKDEGRREALLDALKDAVKADPSRVRVAGITSLGLVEMTRKRQRETLTKSMTRVCPVCGGSGAVLSDDALAHGAYLAVRSAKAHVSAQAYVLDVPRYAAEKVARMAEDMDGDVWIRIGDEIRVTPVRRQEIPGEARRLTKG